MKKPSSVAYMLMEAKLNEQGPNQVANLIAEIKGQKRAEVNQIIKDSFPEFDSLLKIIVTPDANAIEGACVISAIDEWNKCS